MQFFKKSLISLLIISSSFIILTFLLAILSYLNIINDKTIPLFKIFIPIISLFIGGFYIGRHSNEKGWLQGLKISLTFVIIITMINLFFFKYLVFKNILYFIIITISSMLGSMIGISIKKSDK